LQSSVTGVKHEGERLLVSILLPNTDMDIGSTSLIRIITAESRDTLFVPRDSLYESEHGYYVQKSTDEQGKEIEKFIFAIGRTGDDNLIEIKSGVEEGDRIIWERFTQ